MQFIIAAVVGALATAMASLIGRALLALGISFVTFNGFDLGATWLLNQIKSSLSAMPAEVLGFLAWLWVDKAIGMIFSAYAAALTLRTLSSGSFTKMVVK